MGFKFLENLKLGPLGLDNCRQITTLSPGFPVIRASGITALALNIC